MRRRGFVAGLLLVTGIQLAGRQRALSGKVYRIAFVDPVVPTAKQTESTGLLVQDVHFEEEPGRRSAAPHPRRGPAHRRQHSQATGAAARKA
jgi:hypothetical protein